jgi:hypothetical protein
MVKADATVNFNSSNFQRLAARGNVETSDS